MFKSVFVGSILLLACSACFGSLKIIKVAIVDNPRIASQDTWLSQELQNAYIQGVDLAVDQAKPLGYDIDYKTFFYGNNLLDIQGVMPAVNAWNPDAVIGVHNSNQMLMSGYLFKNILVLSLFATDPEIDQLPKSFYTLGVPDKYMLNRLVEYIGHQYPNRGVFIALQVDSKESVDMANLFTQSFQQKHPKLHVNTSKFISSNVDSLDMGKFLQTYHQGDVILLLDVIYYNATDLMTRVSSYLAPEQPVFITDVDNWGSKQMVSDQGKSYVGYRLSPLLSDNNSPQYQAFLKAYEQKYGVPPNFEVSYATYNSVMSIVHALQSYPPTSGGDMRQQILNSYERATAANPYWGRPKQVVIYKMTPEQESLYKILN